MLFGGREKENDEERISLQNLKLFNWGSFWFTRSWISSIDHGNLVPSVSLSPQYRFETSMDWFSLDKLSLGSSRRLWYHMKEEDSENRQRLWTSFDSGCVE